MSSGREETGSLPIDALCDPVLVIDCANCLVDWNDAAEALFPDAGAVEVGADVTTTLGSTAAESLREAIADADAGDPVTVEVRLDAPDAWYELRVHPGGDRHAVVLRDATDRRERRRELERREKVLRHLPDPVYVLDENGGFIYANEAFADIVDVAWHRFFDDDANAGMGMRPEDMQTARNLIRELLSDDPETGDWASFEMVVFTEAGEGIPCENHMAIVLEDGEFWATAGTMHDVTDRRRQAERLEVLERVLRHNLRTEVSIIEGNVDGITDAVDDTAVRASVETVHAAADRLVAMGDKTRRVGTAIVASDDLSAIDLRPTVRSAVERVADERPGAAFEIDVDDGVTVTAGPSLERALVELLENAVEHHDRDRPTVSVSTGTATANTELEYAARKDLVVVEIADEGPGIPDQVRAVAAGDETESPLQHSDGLGLWMAAWVVQEYGGQLEIRDRDPRGTVVEVYLPEAGEE